ncbi:unnamed protein product [Adineta steineri]|uniref:Protein regulator of cytokinesis 1 n=1 Tax=Adineta steineri TaxID=433720 RepID=A0A813X3V6_9BILA|nr:unnamed protein product [Adineta steineri]CAF1432088.1 unnamed protein product [Adineta steineri]
MDNNECFILDHATVCADWYRLWCSFGFTDHQWMSRAEKVEEYTRKLLADQLLAYEEQLIKREQLLKESMDDYEDLLERTGLSSTIETSLFDGLKLKEQEIYIDRKMQELLINEEQLIRQRNELEKKENYLCTILQTTPIKFKENLSISLVQINEKIQEHVKMLSELKEMRLTQISSYYLKLKELSEQLEWTPASSSSTVEYLLLEQFDRCLTADCLNEIETTIHQLEKQIEIQNARFYTLHNQLTHLYERLQKDPNNDYCLAYKTGSENINAFIVKQLEHEILCCREERMQNGKEYCQSIRQQIIDLLDKAHLNDDERIILNKLDFETLSPELLDAYDAEYERILQLYEKRKPILDAYNKWFSFWEEFVAFIKTSTDPGRFHVRGYNAEIEGRQRKKFHRELPIIEQEFLNILAEYNDSTFLIDNIPIRQKFDEAHQQVPATAIPFNPLGKTPIPSRLLGLTPVRSKTPITTPRRVANKEPFVLGTAITSTAKRTVKTPATNLARKLINKVTSHTEGQPIRAKPRAPPPPPPSSAILQLSPPHPLVRSSGHQPTCTDDQFLDFSLLHTMKNVYGQIKVMTSTPNTSFIPMENYHVKTAHNTIGERRSKRRSKKTHPPLIVNVIPFYLKYTNDIKYLFLDGTRYE